MTGGGDHAGEPRGERALRTQGGPAMAKIIISHDDPDNARDALGRGRPRREPSGEPPLPYVRHTQQPDSAREALEEKEAEELLEHGAKALGDERTPRHVVVHASTGTGLWELAESERADVIVFGSDYRTAEGAVMPGTSAQRVLTGGPVAVAVGPARDRDDGHQVRRIARPPQDDGDDALLAATKELPDPLRATR